MSDDPARPAVACHHGAMRNGAEAAPDLFATEQVVTCRDDQVGLRAVIAIDDTRLGPGFGGVRYRRYPSPSAAVEEAQRLAAAMTLKHACAGLPYGGAKAVVLDDGRVADRDELFRRFGDFVARTAGGYIPGVDMGTTEHDMQTVRSRGARAFCADSDPSPWTARGAFAAMRAAVQHAYEVDSMTGLRVAVQGAGHVGAVLARLVAADGGHVLVADVDRERAAAVAEEVGGAVLDPEQVIEADCEVFAPCAVARVLTATTAPRLRARVVAGAANDTLDSPEVARLLVRQGVTYVPDFVANAGGVIQVHAEQSGHDRAQLEAAIERIGERVAHLLADAAERDVTPEDAAESLAADRLAAAAGRWRPEVARS